jgi:nucleoside-diphosphate-sugar epimerase
MLVALTGASGFIGSYTVRALKRQGHDVRALVRRTSRRDHIEKDVREFVEGPQDDREVMIRLCDGVDAVIHNSVDWSNARPGEDSDNFGHFRSNVLGSLDLLETARQAKVGQFLFVSSGAVNHEIVTTPTITETHPTWSGNTYGAYKAAVEPFLKAYRHQYGMNTSIWRPVAVYGVEPKLENSQWFNLIEPAVRGERVDKTGGGKITNVHDVADALALAVGDEQVAGEVYNLAERYLHWCQPPQMAAEVSGSGADVVDHTGDGGPKNQYDPSKAIAFFDRHGHRQGLRRGEDGVRAYVEEVVDRLKAMRAA